MECRGGGEWRGAVAISQESEIEEERERERAMIQMPIAA